ARLCAFPAPPPVPSRSTVFPYTTLFRPPTSGSPGDLVLLAGSAQVSLGASAYGAARGIHEGPATIDLALEARLQRFVLAAHAREIGRDTSELQSRFDLVCRLLLEKKKHN